MHMNPVSASTILRLRSIGVFGVVGTVAACDEHRVRVAGGAVQCGELAHPAGVQRCRAQRFGRGGWRMYLLRQPLWLLGAAAAVGSFLFQAAALHFGSLSVVQPVLVTELVFVLVIRRVWLRQEIRPVAWGSAGLTCVALAVFLAAAEPRGGTAGATANAWVGAVSVCGGASVALTVLGIRGSPVRRAALFGTAAAVVAALAATFIKELTNVLSVDGPVAAVSSWPLYAVIVSSVASGLLVQAALHVGTADGLATAAGGDRPDRQHLAQRLALRRVLHRERRCHRGRRRRVRGVDRRRRAPDADRAPARYRPRISRPASRTDATLAVGGMRGSSGRLSGT